MRVWGIVFILGALFFAMGLLAFIQPEHVVYFFHTLARNKLYFNGVLSIIVGIIAVQLRGRIWGILSALITLTATHYLLTNHRNFAFQFLTALILFPLLLGIVNIFEGYKSRELCVKRTLYISGFLLLAMTITFFLLVASEYLSNKGIEIGVGLLLVGVGLITLSLARKSDALSD